MSADGPPVFRTAFATPFFTIEETVEPAPGDLPHYRLVAPDGAICLPFTPAGEVLLVRQYRHAQGRRTLEIPSGGIDGDEGWEGAARREIAEETAHSVAETRLLGVLRPQLNRNTQREFLVLAFDAAPMAAAEPEAGLDLVRVTRTELAELVRSGAMEQPALVQFVGLASVRLGVDLMTAPMDEIKTRAAALPKGGDDHEG